ncbi:MAG: hypothetical protein HYS20_15200 [Rhodocyclales bacterium]|nr:hypothetical protein [Rhodocyclales bacterium]
MKRWLAAACMLGIVGGAVAADSTHGFTTLERADARALAAPASHNAPTLLKLWSLDCVYCKKNLAVFAELVEADPRLRLLTLAVEQPLPEHARVLDSLGVGAGRYAYGGDAPEALAYAIDPAWGGELPRTLFFDGRGGVMAVSGVVKAERVYELLGLVQPASGR